MKKEKFSETDIKLKNFIKNKQLSPSRIRGYNNVFREIYDKFGFTPSTLLETARNDQRPYIDKDTGSLVFLEMDERTVYTLQTEYYDYLCDQDIKGKPMEPSTIKNKLNTYRGFLSFYEIEMPKPIKIPLTRNRIRDKDIPTWNDVRMAIKLAKSPRDRAVIAMAATTGLRISDIVKLKISDLISACDIYFEGEQPNTLENLLKINPDNIVPCWELNPQKTIEHSNLTITFNTPETTNYIFEYLNHRMKLDIRKGGDGVIDEDEPLFISQRGKILEPNNLSRQCAVINDKMGGEKDKNGLYSKFRLQNLRKLFKTTCRRNISKAQSKIKSDETFDGDIVSLFTGHITPNNPLAHIYEAVPDDHPDSYIRQSYQELIPYLKIVNDTVVKDFKTENYQEWEEEKNAIQKRIDIQDAEHQREMEEKNKEIEKLKQLINQTQKQMDETNKTVEKLQLKRERPDIRNTIKNYFYDNYREDILQKEFEKDGKNHIGHKKCVVICELAYEIALENKSDFSDDDEYLDKLIKKANVKCSLNPDMIITKYNEIHEKNVQIYEVNTKISRVVWDIIGIIGNYKDIWEIVKENQKTLKNTIITHIRNSNYDIDNITLEDKKQIAEDVMMEVIDVL